MLNPRRAVHHPIGGNDSLRNRLLKPSWVAYGKNTLTSLGRMDRQRKGIESPPSDFEHCHIVQFVAILEHGDIGLPRLAVYVNRRHAPAALYDVSICENESDRRD